METQQGLVLKFLLWNTRKERKCFAFPKCGYVPDVFLCNGNTHLRGPKTYFCSHNDAIDDCFTTSKRQIKQPLSTKKVLRYTTIQMKLRSRCYFVVVIVK